MNGQTENSTFPYPSDAVGKNQLQLKGLFVLATELYRSLTPYHTALKSLVTDRNFKFISIQAYLEKNSNV